MVETYQEGVRSRGANQQDLQVRADPDAFGAGIGRAVQQLGSVFGNVATAMAAKDDLTAEADAREAENSFIKTSQDVRYDLDGGYLNQTGANAAGGRKAYDDTMAAARDQAAANLSPAARKKFLRNTDGLMNGVREQGIRHEATQFRDYVFSSGKASADIHMNEALLHPVGSPAFMGNLDRAMGELDRINALAGLSGEAALVARRDLRSGALRAGIASVASSGTGGPTRAADLLEANKALMSTEDYLELETALRPAVVQDQAFAAVNSLEAASGSSTVGNQRAQVSPNAAAERGTHVDHMLSGGKAPSNVTYANRGATRDMDITPSLLSRIGITAEAVYGPGTKVIIYSGGQLDAAEAKKQGKSRVGTEAHDHGKAADVYIIGPDGKRITGDGLGPLVQTWLASGYGGVGVEMSGGGIHLDEHRTRTWDYVGKGGSVTKGQQAAQAAGLRGEMPEGAMVGMVQGHLIRTFGQEKATAIESASGARGMVEILGLDVATAMGVAGLTVGTYKRSVQTALGEAGAPNPGGGRTPDYAAMYGEVERVMRTDPELGAAMMAEIDARVEASNKTQSATRQELFDDVRTRGLETGEWALSIDERIGLGATLSSAFDTAATSSLQGIQNTDPLVFGELTESAVRDPANFVKIDLGDMLAQGLLSDGDYRTMRTLQVEMMAATDPVQREGAFRKAMGGVDPRELWAANRETYNSLMGYDATDKKATQAQREQTERFKRALAQRVAEATSAKGAEVTPLEKQAIVYDMLRMVPVTTPGRFWGESTDMIPAFDASLSRETGTTVARPVIGADQVPPGVRDKIDKLVPPTMTGSERNNMTALLYNDMLLVADGGTPQVGLDDIPPVIAGTATLGEGGETVYTIPGAPGTLTETELLTSLATLARERLLQAMARAGISVDELIRDRPISANR